MLKFPRTIRLDPSDTFVFERAAEPGEWAVSGAFVFWNQDAATLSQKQRVALRSGFLGIDSLGWSTLAIVTEATEAERQAMAERLAGQLLERFGAPDFGQVSRMLACDTQNLSCFEMQLSRVFIDGRNKALTGLHSCLQGRWPPPWSLKQH